MAFSHSTQEASHVHITQFRQSPGCKLQRLFAESSNNGLSSFIHTLFETNLVGLFSLILPTVGQHRMRKDNCGCSSVTDGFLGYDRRFPKEFCSFNFI
jgi:hypothetical protein